MMVSWLVWITLHYPGAMRDDTLPQLFQSLGYLDYYTQHPIFDTLIFGAFFKLGFALGSQWLGLYIFLIVQAVVTAATFTYLLSYLRKHGAPRAFVIIALLFFIFARVIYSPLNTMSKDAVNGWSFVLACIYMLETIRTKGAWLTHWKNLVAFVAVALFCIASKRTMMYLIVPFMIIASLFIFKRSKTAAALSLLAGILPAFLFSYALTPLIDSTLSPIHSVTYEMYSIPIQQVVRTVKDNPNALTANEKTELSRTFDINRAVKIYNPHRSDEANTCWKPGSVKSVFFKTWLRLATRYPVSYLEAFECLSGQWMSLNDNIDYNRDLHVLDSNEQMAVWNTMQYITDKAIAYATVFPIPEPPSGLVPTIANKLDNAQAKLPLISSYGLYCFAIPFAVFVYAIARKNGTLFIATLIWAALFASFIVGPIALYWYTIPAAFTAPLVLALPYLLKKWRQNR